MRNPATPSIDQVLVLLATVEAGSFTAAAKRLGRATSAISYAIDTLEDQLGLRLFDRGGKCLESQAPRFEGDCRRTNLTGCPLAWREWWDATRRSSRFRRNRPPEYDQYTERYRCGKGRGAERRSAICPSSRAPRLQSKDRWP
jgi:hypothetical protein